MGLNAHAQIVFGSGQLTTPTSTVPPEQRCTVSGQLTNAVTGEPLKHATIRLSIVNNRAGSSTGPAGFRNQNGQGYSASSNADGSFLVQNIEPGTYTLQATKTGFLPGSFGARNSRQRGADLVLQPSQSRTGLSVVLQPQAVVAGRVLDEDGEPAANVGIQLYGTSWSHGQQRMQPRGGGNTNDLGEFRLANLQPGRYFLVAQKQDFVPASSGDTSKGEVRPVRTWYPGVPSIDSASALSLQVGQDLTGLELRLQTAPTFHVRGHVAADAESQQNAMVTLMAGDSNPFFPVGSSQVSAKGTFDISGVPAGSYTARLMQMGRGMRTVGQQAVTVAGTDVSGITLSPGSGQTVTGKIRVEGAPPAGVNPIDLTTISVNFEAADSSGAFGPRSHHETKADGTFTQANLDPVRYYVAVRPPTGTYVKAILAGQTDITTSGLDLSNGGAGDIAVILSYGTADVSGVVQVPQASGGAAASISAQVALVPDPVNPDSSGIRLVATDTSGTFTLSNVPPGKYRIYAFEQADYEQLQNPAVVRAVESSGSALEIKENEKKQATPALVTAEQYNDLLARAGVPPTQ